VPDIIRGDHHWVGSANISIDPKQIPRAVRRGTVRVIQDETIDVLEVYCSACKQPYEKCHGEECILGDHHRGGPIGTRAKRKRADEQDETQAPSTP
jgi:hypothetical protein